MRPRADIGQGERTTSGSSSFLTGLLGMTRQSGGSTLAFTRTPGGSLVSMRSGTSHFYYIFDALGSVIALPTARVRLRPPIPTTHTATP